jgi:phospholipid-binding lipoprotein MlaA
VKKLLAAAVILAFFSIISVANPSYASDGDRGIYLAQTSPESSAKDKEDEDVEEDEEYDDEVAQINDPLYGINYAFFKLNDILYVVIMKPAAQTYNFFIPVEFRTVISNFFYNLRFPIRFVNSLLQFKGTKAVHELGGFLLNSTIGIAGLGEVASHWDLKPSPEDLGQTFGYWGAGDTGSIEFTRQCAVYRLVFFRSGQLASIR